MVHSVGGQCQISLEDLLFFVTGVRAIPPLGFNPQPTVSFLHEPEINDQLSAFPKANTCLCALQLPVLHSSYANFIDNFLFAVRNSQGFGYA